jgi:phosphatidylglycerophosphate synthase
MLFLDSSRLPVAFWLPNLLGYIRVATLLAAAFDSNPTSMRAMNLLVISFALDYFDGPAARAFGMCSQFGDILDHVTDHATMMWLVWLTTDTSGALGQFNLVANGVCNFAAIAYMAVFGFYFKHAKGTGNWIQRSVEEGNYWNLPSLLWAANTIIIPVFKLSYGSAYAQLGLNAMSSTPLLDLTDALGLIVTVSYTAACVFPRAFRR